MKKGFLFLIVISALFWGIYYTSDLTKNATAPGSEPSVQLHNMTAESNRVVHQANRHILETSIEIFKERENRPPAELKELVEKGYLTKIPDSGSIGWNYNPSDGEIR